MVLPTFFSDLTAMLNGKVHSFQVDGNEAMTYYKFNRNGLKLKSRLNIIIFVKFMSFPYIIFVKHYNQHSENFLDSKE